jgi:hypothetical protein
MDAPMSCSTMPWEFWLLMASLLSPWDRRLTPVTSSLSLSSISIVWKTNGLRGAWGSGKMPSCAGDVDEPADAVVQEFPGVRQRALHDAVARIVGEDGVVED